MDTKIIDRIRKLLRLAKSRLGSLRLRQDDRP